MKIGEAIRVKGFKAHFHGAKVRGDVDYKAAPGKYFVLLVLGVENAGSYALDPTEVLKAHGWTPPSEKPKRKRKVVTK